jgi:hypothetical protein
MTWEGSHWAWSAALVRDHDKHKSVAHAIPIQLKFQWLVDFDKLLMLTVEQRQKFFEKHTFHQTLASIRNHIISRSHIWTISELWKSHISQPEPSQGKSSAGRELVSGRTINGHFEV